MSASSNPAAGADPSMEDILASIRRILSEDETGAGASSPDAPAGPASTGPAADGRASAGPAARAVPSPASTPADVLALDTSMLVDEPTPAKSALEPVLATVTPLRATASAGSPEAVGTLAAATQRSTSNSLESQAPVITMQSSAPADVSPSARTIGDRESLVAPEAAAAASTAVGSLMRKLSSERNAAISRGGPTLEDLVREEMRPMLKQWLDTNLAPIVERLVRAEIERVVNNAAF